LWRPKISRAFEVIPAIDLRGGRCVRLYQGDYDRETIFSDHPVDVAQRWVEQGASRLHIVDLDGARDGNPVNLAIIKQIALSAGVPVQVGGGIRSLETAVNLKSAGVDRLIVGTAALENPDFVRELCDDTGAESVIVGIDAKDGYVAVKGWTEQSKVKATDLAKQMSELGVLRIAYTDISRDGTLGEPNFDAIESLNKFAGVSLIAAGGVSAVSHVTRLAGIGIEGAIVGRAIYTGDLSLKDAIRAVSNRLE
jgi:phosphoribosylformimino-5-aminoimidazole carboxamide ribotide isomerase